MEENESQTAEVQRTTKELTFELDEDSYGLKTYQAILENTLDKEIDYYSLEINLLDSNEMIIENTYAFSENIRSGQKAVLEFITDKYFVAYDIKVECNFEE